MSSAIRLTSSLNDPLRNKKVREIQIKLIKYDEAALRELIAKPIEQFAEEESRQRALPSLNLNVSRGPGRLRGRRSAAPDPPSENVSPLQELLPSIETNGSFPRDPKRKEREAGLSPPVQRAHRVFVDLTEDSDDE